MGVYMKVKKAGNRSRTIQVTLTEVQYKWLKSLVGDRGLSMSQLVLNFIDREMMEDVDRKRK